MTIPHLFLEIKKYSFSCEDKYFGENNLFIISFSKLFEYGHKSKWMFNDLEYKGTHFKIFPEFEKRFPDAVRIIKEIENKLNF